MFGNSLILVGLNIFAAVVLRLVKPNLATALVLAVVLIGSTGFVGAHYGDEILLSVYRMRDRVLTWKGSTPHWPPEKYRTYPDLELRDQSGKFTRLSDFRGKVILLEPVGMSCPASVALAGGKRLGSFQGVMPQSNLNSIEQYAWEFAHTCLDDERIVHVQLILFNKDMKPPTDKDVRDWARHFRRQRNKNQVVLCGTADLCTRDSRDMVPGLQLIDQNFLLRCNSTGQTPEDNLFRDLLPMLARVLRE